MWNMKFPLFLGAYERNIYYFMKFFPEPQIRGCFTGQVYSESTVVFEFIEEDPLLVYWVTYVELLKLIDNVENPPS